MYVSLFFGLEGKHDSEEDTFGSALWIRCKSVDSAFPTQVSTNQMMMTTTRAGAIDASAVGLFATYLIDVTSSCCAAPQHGATFDEAKGPASDQNR